MLNYNSGNQIHLNKHDWNPSLLVTVMFQEHLISHLKLLKWTSYLRPLENRIKVTWHHKLKPLEEGPCWAKVVVSSFVLPGALVWAHVTFDGWCKKSCFLLNWFQRHWLFVVHLRTANKPKMALIKRAAVAWPIGLCWLPDKNRGPDTLPPCPIMYLGNL